MAAAAVASAVTPPPTLRVAVSSLMQFKDKALALVGRFEQQCIKNADNAHVIKRRMDLAQQMGALLADYSRDTRSMLLDGTALDFDLPLFLFDTMLALMDRIAKECSAKLVPQLRKVADDAKKNLDDAKGQTPQQRLGHARAILDEINKVHLELKRVIAEFGAFFQPLATIPAGFFAVPAVDVRGLFLKAVAKTWCAVHDEIKRSVFAAVDVDRAVFHQQDAKGNAEAVKLRAGISDAITLWVRIQEKGADLLTSKFIPDYLTAAQTALEKIGAKMAVKTLLDVIVVRIDNESDRFQQIFARNPTPVRRVVQLGLVKSQVQRISTDAEIGLDAALKFPPRADLFPKLVLMLDFDEACIKTICEAIQRNVAASLGYMLSNNSGAGAGAGAGAGSSDDVDENIIGSIAEVYEAYRAVISDCKAADAKYVLRFYVALRGGINGGLPHEGLETVLVQHLHRLLKDSGALPAADVQFRAYDIRAAASSFAPLLKDVALFVRVYQHRLGTRLMSRKAPNTKLERFAISELTASIGVGYTHPLSAMVQQFAESTEAKRGFVAFSKYAWPSFSMVSSASVVLHPAVAPLVQAHVDAFKAKEAAAVKDNTAGKKNSSNSAAALPVNASAHPLLTSVELRTGNNAGVFGNAVQCSILLHLAEAQAQGGLRADDVAGKVKITEREAAWMLGTLVRSKVAVQDTASGKFTAVALEPAKRVVLSSVWGHASRNAASAAKARAVTSAAGGGAGSDDDAEDASQCTIQ